MPAEAVSLAGLELTPGDLLGADAGPRAIRLAIAMAVNVCLVMLGLFPWRLISSTIRAVAALDMASSGWALHQFLAHGAKLQPS